MKRVCNEDCNNCPLLNHENGKMITKIMNEGYGKFGNDFYKIVETNCPNLTCCFKCHIDDFCHFEGCNLDSERWDKKISEWNSTSWRQDTDRLLIKKLKEKGFDKRQIFEVLTIIDETCNYCWDDEKGCQCWNDD